MAVDDSLTQLTLLNGDPSEPPNILVKATADGGGQIGINTDSPAEALEVVGNVHVEGTITGNGTGLTNVNAALLGGIPGDEYLTLEDMTQQVLGYDPSDPYPGPTFWQASPDVVPLTVQSTLVDQAANLQEWKNSSGDVLMAVGPAGGLKIPTDAADGHVLTSDDDGNGTWQAPASGAGVGEAGEYDGEVSADMVEDQSANTTINFGSPFTSTAKPHMYLTVVLKGAADGLVEGAAIKAFRARFAPVDSENSSPM